MKVGVISDTHNFIDPTIPAIFAGVNHILHAGDIGMPWIISELEQIAPVTAVLGNNDMDLRVRETEVVELAAWKFLLHHIVNPRALAESIKARVLQERPSCVVFGHTHQPFAQTRGGTLYLNPGYAGKPRFRLPRSVAVLEWNGSVFQPRFVGL